MRSLYLQMSRFEVETVVSSWPIVIWCMRTSWGRLGHLSPFAQMLVDTEFSASCPISCWDELVLENLFMLKAITIPSNLLPNSFPTNYHHAVISWLPSTSWGSVEHVGISPTDSNVRKVDTQSLGHEWYIYIPAVCGVAGLHSSSWIYKEPLFFVAIMLHNTSTCERVDALHWSLRVAKIDWWNIREGETRRGMFSRPLSVHLALSG